MRRFSKKDRVSFKHQGKTVKGEVLDELSVDFNPTYLVKVDEHTEPVYVTDVAGNELKSVRDGV